MSVTGINNNQLSSLDLLQLYQTQLGITSTSDSGSTDASSAVGQSDSFDLSKPAELYSKLQALAQSDPEKLKTVCAAIAEKLKSAAESATGRDSKMLSDLAEKFQSVADGGDVSQLKPPDPPQMSGGPPPPPADAYSKQQDGQLAELLNGQNNQGTGSSTDMEQLLSSIIKMVDDALGN